VLRKATTLSETLRIVLMSDPAVWQAQLVAARTEVDQELEKAETGEFMEKVIALLRTTTKTHIEMIDSLAALKGSALELFENLLVGDEAKSLALEKLTESMKDEDTRTALAFARTHGVVQAYRETSDPSVLMDQNPADATWIEIKPLSRSDIRNAERAVGPRPSLGAVLASKGLDAARRASRRGEDGPEAYARYMADLTEGEQREIYSFEDWNEALDIEVFSRSVVKVGGFDLEPDSGMFPVAKFRDQCADAESVISETARHSRQIGALDPKVGWPSSWRSGTSELSEGVAA